MLDKLYENIGEIIDTLDVIAYNTYRDTDKEQSEHTDKQNDNSKSTTAKQNVAIERLRYFSQQQR